MTPLEAAIRTAEQIEQKIQALPARERPAALIIASHQWGDIVHNGVNEEAANKLAEQVVELIQDIDLSSVIAALSGVLALSVDPIFRGPISRTVAVGGISKIIGRVLENIAETRVAMEEAEKATKQ